MATPRLMAEERISRGLPPRRDSDEATEMDGVARAVLAVASGACTVQAVADAAGWASKSTAAKYIALAREADFIVDLADAAGAVRHGTLRPRLEIVQLAKEMQG